MQKTAKFEILNCFWLSALPESIFQVNHVQMRPNYIKGQINVFALDGVMRRVPNSANMLWIIGGDGMI
ncbi:hypothetical protein AKJ51_02880 [candidate division MSBL1 archaeon SCGC-AAA382A20]|uniref:Uncharacterized protein n=1 Tax=candidate division MSBL1 archaeon SCGC-AAA382A20 TaxID=1698280 RepID=A0A133VK62_9EURY|nr:hypothetical protein AKJ51_02880 [candidate division MSBL1 archaeon SCGC-AAA382A20]